MTKDEFNKTEWCAGMGCVYGENDYDVVGVDFQTKKLLIRRIGTAEFWCPIRYIDKIFLKENK